MRISKRTNATIILIIINLAVYFFVFILSHSRRTIDLYNLILIYGGISRGALLRGLFYTPLTALFLHGNMLHILFNMYALFQLGYLVEGIYGMRKFLIFYFVSGIIGNLTAATMTPYITIGSSSAIFGLVGVLFALGFKKDTPVVLKSVTGLSLLPIILLNLMFGLMIPNISNSAHVGGLIAGSLLGWFILPQYAIVRKPRVSRVKQRSPEEIARDILLKYVPILNALKNSQQDNREIDERTVQIAQLRKELSELADYELAYKVLGDLYRRNLITDDEFEKLRKFI
ncbi:MULTISPECIES: rhomboid family intramembrane serine protease [unclassified Kosmotoga]|uniref:rhomboid family intramembrane serine protease n=1 Tax=unclassified Kosmotoga TaxID=2631489 RepID=UPI0007D79C22|nr:MULTISPECIES: rhomboid family intramembrane serine protease [unclassified Kosmotoga]MDI3523523.1 hypothetical protein [Kosmotoga sp.]MDK2953077.1 hypothetical protein [Kosmotoga sp.]OAA20214.1 protease [Kosmotoga sp. DU53]